MLNAGGGEFSVSAWVYTRNINKAIFFGKYGATGNGWRLVSTPWGRLVLEGNGTQRYSDPVIGTLQWQHVAAVQTASGVTLYVNGADVTNDAAGNGNYDNGTGLTIGTTPLPPLSSCCQVFFDGMIDDLRIYSGALTQLQVQTDMSTPVGGGAPPQPTDTEPPSVPLNLTATALASQVNLAWSASSDNVGVTGYRIYRCQGAACTPTAQTDIVGGTSYQNTGLAANTTYRYAVAAQDARRLRAESNTPLRRVQLSA